MKISSKPIEVLCDPTNPKTVHPARARPHSSACGEIRVPSGVFTGDGKRCKDIRTWIVKQTEFWFCTTCVFKHHKPHQLSNPIFLRSLHMVVKLRCWL